jgi:hypothetical protein
LPALFQSAEHIYEKREGFEAGSVPLTNGSGSGRPKNMRIRFRILISNTAENYLALNDDNGKRLSLLVVGDLEVNTT